MAKQRTEEITSSANTADGHHHRGGLCHFQLSNGLRLYAVSEIDARLEAQAQQEAEMYYGNGMITLSPGDTVLDVGGNIGSFARMASEAVGPTGKVYCIEPLPDVQKALQLNIAEHRLWADHKHMKIGEIIPVACGVGDGHHSTAQFVYYPRCTALSTMYPDQKDVLEATLSLVRHSGKSTSSLQRLGHWLDAWFPWLYHKVHSLVFPRVYLAGEAVVECKMKSISTLMKELLLQKVDLIKINVERAELDVLRGIRHEDWPCISQVAMQLHDREDRLQQALQVLNSAGLSIIKVAKEPRFQDCCLVMIYARRPTGQEPV